MTFAKRTCSISCAGALLVSIGSLNGCSSSSGGKSTPTEVGSISAFDTDVTFYSMTLDGHTDIGIMETHSAFTPNVLPTLLAQGLTTQEVYLALAPAGATAPPALVAAQADEAAWIGRSADVRHVTIDSSQFVQKSLSACESWLVASISPPDPGHSWVINPFSAGNRNFSSLPWGVVYEPTKGCFPTTSWVILGACNENAEAQVDVKAFQTYGTNCGNVGLIGETSLGGFRQVSWYWHNTGGAVYTVDGDTHAADDAAPGASFDLVTGYER
jgi:hypothetical protein